MCRFRRVDHDCGHKSLITHPVDTQLCEWALLFGLKQGLHRAPAFCTPVGPHGRDDLYNEDLVYNIEDDYSYCPICHAIEGSPVVGDLSDQSIEAQNLDYLRNEVVKQYGLTQNDYQEFEDNAKDREIAATIDNAWLREMLRKEAPDKYLTLGMRVLRELQDTEVIVRETLAKCGTGIPRTNMLMDFYAVDARVARAFEMVCVFYYIMEMVQHVPEGKQHYNEICKQAELMKALFDGPQEPPEDHLYLQPGAKTPTAFKYNPTPQVTSGHSDLPTQLKTPIKQLDVLPFRRPDFKGPPKFVSSKKSPPPAITAHPPDDEERAKFGTLEVRYF